MSTKDAYYDMDVLARTIYGESEPNNVQEATAIAAVIMNRVGNPRWKAHTAAEICLQPLQFSCWNSNDPNRARIMKASDGWFDACNSIAKNAIEYKSVDPTFGATHYYLDRIPVPKWAKGRNPCYISKHRNGSAHLFFNNIDSKAPEATAKSALDSERPLASTRTAKGGMIAATTGLASVAVDLGDVKSSLEPLAWYNTHIQSILVALTLVGAAIMLWARYDDRKKGKR